MVPVSRVESRSCSISKPVSIPLNDAVSVFKVSLPIELLSFNVCIPLEAFLDSPANSLATLKSRLVATKAIPQGLFSYDLNYISVHFTCDVNYILCSLDYPCLLAQLLIYLGWLDNSPDSGDYVI